MVKVLKGKNLAALLSSLLVILLAVLPLLMLAWVLHDSAGRGLFLLVWGLGVVGLLDNFLKPVLIGSRARMPFMLIFFGMIGGIRLYGLLGFILGPVLVASFLVFVKIYREEYAAA